MQTFLCFYFHFHSKRRCWRKIKSKLYTQNSSSFWSENGYVTKQKPCFIPNYSTVSRRQSLIGKRRFRELQMTGIDTLLCNFLNRRIWRIGTELISSALRSHFWHFNKSKLLRCANLPVFAKWRGQKFSSILHLANNPN